MMRFSMADVSTLRVMAGNGSNGDGLGIYNACDGLVIGRGWNFFILSQGFNGRPCRLMVQFVSYGYLLGSRDS
jgi:hypothetical protein